MLNQSANNMTRILSEDEKLDQLDGLWNMYSAGVNCELFGHLCVLPTEALREYKTNNIFHEIMINFIIDYRKYHNTL